MGRYEFIEEDDQNDDHDEEWRNPQHRSHPPSSLSGRKRIHATIRHSNSYGSREEGEIVEENDDIPSYNQYDRNPIGINNCDYHPNDASDHSYCSMDTDDDHNDGYHSDDPYHRGSFRNDPSPRSQRYDIDGYDDVDNHHHNDEEEEEDRFRHHERRPLSSYLPSFSGLASNARDHRGYGGRRRSPSPDSEEPAHRNHYPNHSPNPNHYRNKENLVNEAGREEYHSGKEYRLIGSSKYDRSYDREDFYRPPHASSTDPDERHHAVSEDEREYHSHSHPSAPSTTATTATAVVTRSRNNGQLSSSSSSSTTAPEIHYHIYVSEDQAARWFPPCEGERDAGTSDGAPPFKSSESRSHSYGSLPLWKKLTLLACITQLLWMLAASRMTPPPPYLTWDEYGKHQWRLARRVSSEGYALGRHLLRTAALRGGDGDGNNYEDGLDDTANHPIYRFPDTWWPASAEEASRGRRRHNASGTASASRRVSENIGGVGSVLPEAGWWLAGQDRARKHLQSRLNKWSSSPSPGSTRAQQTSATTTTTRSRPLGARSSSKRGPSFSSWSSRSPLVIYASGGKGVGKRSLAYLLLQQLETEGPSKDRKRSAWEECEEAWSHRAARSRAHSAEEEDSEQSSPYCPLLHLTPSDYHHRSAGGSDPDYLDYESPGSGMNSAEDDGGDSDSEPSSPLYRQILDHVVAAGGGASIVLLERVDCASASASPSLANPALVALPEDCPHPPSSSSSSFAAAANPNSNPDSNLDSGHEEDWLLDLTAALRRRPAVFGNTIVVVTSRLGTATAEKWARKRLQQQNHHHRSQQQHQHNNAHRLPDDWLVADEVQSLVRYELRKHHSGGGEREREHERESRLDNWWIVPMVPLERDAMASILDAMAASGGKDFASAVPPPARGDHGGRKHFTDDYDAHDHGPGTKEDHHHQGNGNENGNGNDNDTVDGGVLLTERASAGILDRLEWHQWIHKTTGAVLRVWSPDGAAPLRDLWNHRIRPRLSSALASGCGGAPPDGSGKPNDSDGDGNGDGGRTLLLDADGGSSADRWILRSCVAAAADGEDSAVAATTTTDGRRWKCREDSIWNSWNEQACQFYL